MGAPYADMVELVDTLDLGSSAARRESSSLSFRTKLKRKCMDIEKLIIHSISRTTGLTDIDIHADLSDLGFDSLTIVEVVMELEDVFNIEIPDNDMDSFESVHDVIEYIKSTL